MRKKAATAKTSLNSGRTAATGAGTAVAGGSGLLILVELGGHWPDLAEMAGADQRRVVTQLEGETPVAFAERVTNGFDGLFGKGVALATLVLACNERIDLAADSARRQLASTALGAMAKQRAGKVYLAASPLASGRLRHALAGLAQGLFDEWRTAGLDVTTELSSRSSQEPAPAGASTFVFTARVA